MPLLCATDRLTERPQRVLVAGASGAGKTTLARVIASVLDLPHVELDGLFHGPGWVPRPSFDSEVRTFTSAPAWVAEWQYRSARPLLAARADLVVWLDLPRALVMRQVLRRTVVRRLRREVLWNDNVEPPMWRMLVDPEHVVRWAWTTYPLVAPRVVELQRRRPDLAVVRLSDGDEVRTWVGGPLRGVSVGR